MKLPGRPDYEQLDRVPIVEMAAIWRAGNSEYSIARISLYVVGFKSIPEYSFRTKLDKDKIDKEYRDKNKYKFIDPIPIKINKDDPPPCEVAGSEVDKSTAKGPKSDARYLEDISKRKESNAKRLVRLFKRYNNQDLMVPISIYCLHHHRRYTELQNGKPEVGGPFYARHLPDPTFVEADKEALKSVAGVCGIEFEDAKIASAKGLEILKGWFPDTYYDSRI